MAREILDPKSDNPIQVKDTTDGVFELFRIRTSEATDTKGHVGKGIDHNNDYDKARHDAISNVRAQQRDDD